jgi:hypothetical protein
MRDRAVGESLYLSTIDIICMEFLELESEHNWLRNPRW